jgi:hypothetical protein
MPVMLNPRAGGRSRNDWRHCRPIGPQRYETITTSSTALHGSGLPKRWSCIEMESAGGRMDAMKRRRGSREPNLASSLEGRLRPGDVFVDVG